MIGNREKAILYIMSLPEGALVEVKEWKEKRSRQQNRYYWALVTRIAGKMNLSKSAVHNLMLRDYGQRAVVGGETPVVYLPDTEATEREILNSDTLHLKPTSFIKGGKRVNFRAYRLLLGSSYYNTAEMAELLEGTVQEAKSLDIETLTPQELQRMREEDEKHEKGKCKKHDSGGF